MKSEIWFSDFDQLLLSLNLALKSPPLGCSDSTQIRLINWFLLTDSGISIAARAMQRWRTQWKWRRTVAALIWVGTGGFKPLAEQNCKDWPPNCPYYNIRENGGQKRTKTGKLFLVRFCVQTLAEDGGLARNDRTTPNECLASVCKSGVSGSRKLWALWWATLGFRRQLWECRWLSL